MLENISLIASIICGLTAITTSLRAVGTAREYSRHENVPSSQRSSLKLHLAVTIIWFILSLVFIAPLFLQQCEGELTSRIIAFIVPFILLAIIICLIWQKVIHIKNR